MTQSTIKRIIYNWREKQSKTYIGTYAYSVTWDDMGGFNKIIRCKRDKITSLWLDSEGNVYTCWEDVCRIKLGEYV